ncbi:MULTISPECIES: hypothetical protein [Curtobacterium]|uniref:hypothetical protein n=1 Tax=Curtobacterium flaccumfaciens TaxID=2035 RepID=UPI003EE5957F
MFINTLSSASNSKLADEFRSYRDQIRWILGLLDSTSARRFEHQRWFVPDSAGCPNTAPCRIAGSRGNARSMTAWSVETHTARRSTVIPGCSASSSSVNGNGTWFSASGRRAQKCSEKLASAIAASTAQIEAYGSALKLAGLEVDDA